jgi:oligopeptide/dipeptide ABC transporter ATP-binding protein
MYKGSIVEQGRVAEVFTAPQHPYTASLLSSASPPIEPAEAEVVPSQPLEVATWPSSK